MHTRRSKRHIHDDVRSQKSHYTNVSKNNSGHDKDVELSLEVELDDEVRSIIKNSDKCPSALLDVTVIKPKGFDQYSRKTQILKTDQVKLLIESMQLDKTDKRTLMEKLFGVGDYVEGEQAKKKSVKLKSKHVYRQSSVTSEHGDVRCVTDDANSAVFSMYAQPDKSKKPGSSSSPPHKQQQIYTTPKTYENIRSMFVCKNQQENREDEKIDQPCLCQNCAIVGILTDSQKKPFATELIPDPFDPKDDSRYRRPCRKKSVSFKPLESIRSSHDQCQAIFKLLSTRITELEKRVMMQEQKAVPKDYFKKIITKLVNHLSRLTHYTTEERNSVQSSSRRGRDVLPPQNKYYKYHVNTTLLDNSFKYPAERELDPKPCSSTDVPPLDSLWKWGEDMLTSGRGLKNKVVLLLEDTLHNLKGGQEKPQPVTCREGDDDVQLIVDELSRKLEKTVRGGKKATSLKQKGLEKKNGRPSLIPRYTYGKKKEDPVVSVAYVNPQASKWPKESSVSFKIETSECSDNMNDSKRKRYKIEFLKILENTKTTDKLKLWQNIWNQALENRQTKTDSVTIQIPDPKDLLRQKMIHLEYTIGELEKLLLNDLDQRNVKK